MPLGTTSVCLATVGAVLLFASWKRGLIGPLLLGACALIAGVLGLLASVALSVATQLRVATPVPFVVIGVLLFAISLAEMYWSTPIPLDPTGSINSTDSDAPDSVSLVDLIVILVLVEGILLFFVGLTGFVLDILHLHV